MTANNNITNSLANKSLQASAQLWFILAVFGQWFFVVYIANFFGSAAVEGNYQGWNKVLVNGYKQGETMNNIALGSHLLLAFTMHFLGPLQLIPKVRDMAPTFHRWNGRVYILSAFIISISGLYLTWTTIPFGGDRLGVTINGLVILLCATMAYRYARAYDFDSHRRWAIRLFLVVAGVWFFRIGLMFWLFVNKGPVGFDMETFQGPFLSFLGLAQTFLPLAIAELYFRAQDSNNSKLKWFSTSVTILFSIVTAIGIFAAAMMMWIPRM